MTHEKIRGARTAYDLARLLLAERGIHTADQAYAHCPEMPPRTVRRIFEHGADLMGDGISLPEHNTHSDSIPDVLVATITEKARAAKVSLRAALSAVLRFGNPPERVEKVLDDLKVLASKTPPRNPSGLFVFAMRTGEDIKLPDTMMDRREAEKPTHPPLSVGEWVRWCGEWMRVMEFRRTQTCLSPTDDPMDLYLQPTENLLRLPRRPHPAG